MTTTTAGYMAKVVGTKQIYVSNTNLFDVAATHLGDATLWYIIADMNGLTDPWIGELTSLQIPISSTNLVSNGGILGQ
jgi:hypothetical protein